MAQEPVLRHVLALWPNQKGIDMITPRKPRIGGQGRCTEWCMSLYITMLVITRTLV